MANLLGDLWTGGEPDWPAALAFPDVKLHLYGKREARPGRKMGHLTALAPTAAEARDLVVGARKALGRGPESATTGVAFHARRRDNLDPLAGLTSIILLRAQRFLAAPAAVTALVALVGVSTSARQARTPILARFLARLDPPAASYRALRHLEAHNERFHANAWMDAWTDFDAARGFRYQVASEGGSGYIRSRVFRAALDGEQKLWMAHEPERAELTRANYEFADRGLSADGAATLAVTPRRKDLLLIDGAIFVSPADADLLRVEGQLSKTPSFWTRRVEVVRRYERVAGIRLPVSIESTAHVLIAGRSTFRMTYEYSR